jgi:TonB family protein
MSRLQKKCFFAVAGLHLLLLVILIVGPAFLSSSVRDQGIPPVDFVSSTTLDSLLSGGGNRTATTPPPRTPPVQQPMQQPPQQPVQQPVAPPVAQPPPQPAPPVREPAARQEPVPETKPLPRATEAWAPAVPSHKKKEMAIDTTLVDRKSKPTSKSTAKTSESTTARDRQAAAARQAAEAVGKTLASLNSGLSQSTKIEMPDPGPGGGGPAYANFYAVVEGIYQRAWDDGRPSGVSEDAAAVVSVTIARDGTVLSGRIEESSGNAIVDRAIQHVLDRVRVAAPLPESSSESECTISIRFVATFKGVAG